MSQNTSTAGPSEDVKRLAEKISNYETREKGVMGKLFAFESRDGFWSKLAKTLGPIASAVTGGLATFAAVSGVMTGPVGLAVAGVAAAAVGLLSGAVNRAANKEIFSDLHDSHKGNLGKFGHYLAVGLAAKVANDLVNAALPGLGPVASNAVAAVSINVVNPLVRIFTSKAISAGLGDQKLRKESAEAKEIAQRAMQSGKSVEQLLEHEKPLRQAPGYSASESPEQAQEHGRKYTKLVEQQRATSQNISIV
ncbi:MAG: hypothetical protein EBV03_03620 [Proteobacteria bacterium]|nr:hypothetical protein [Pseudomonadota bacterium]